MTSLLLMLIHSPLVGPGTWRPVRDELIRLSQDVMVPILDDSQDNSAPFWRQHARSVQRSLSETPPGTQVVLIAHSGAGPLLPAITQASPRPVAGYVFVDAGIPRSGFSRLDLMRLQDAEWAEKFDRSLTEGERFPAWKEQDLEPLVPNLKLRRQLMAEINPRARPFFTEPLPEFDSWPDAPCAYIRFSAAYDGDFVQAKTAGWQLAMLDAGHFHMLVDPEGVAQLLTQLVDRMDIGL